MCCLPAERALPAAAHSMGAPNSGSGSRSRSRSRSCSGAQALAARLRWIGDRLEKSRRAGGRRSSKQPRRGVAGDALLRGLFAVCAAVQMSAFVLLVGKRHL